MKTKKNVVPILSVAYFGIAALTMNAQTVKQAEQLLFQTYDVCQSNGVIQVIDNVLVQKM
jgi:hypothetical protein